MDNIEAANIRIVDSSKLSKDKIDNLNYGLDVALSSNVFPVIRYQANQSYATNSLLLKYIFNNTGFTIQNRLKSANHITEVFNEAMQFYKEKNKSVFITKLKNLFTKLAELVKILFSKENTQQTIYAKLNNVLRRLYGDESKIYIKGRQILGLGAKRNRERIIQYNTNVENKNLDLDKSEYKFNINQLQRICEDLDRSAHSYDHIILVMLNTGSRMIEVLKISKYVSVDKNKMLSILDAAKGSADRKIIPNCISPVRVVELVDNIRNTLHDQLNGKTNVEINNSLNKVINQRIEYIFQNKDMSSHILRRISAEWNYNMYGGNSVKVSYIKKYLGHLNVSSTLPYMNIIIDRNEQTTTPVLTDRNTPYFHLSNIKRRGVDINEKLAKIRELDRLYERDTGSRLKSKDMAALYKYTLKDIVKARA
jgi:integrase